jgi:hypothetical protein
MLSIFFLFLPFYFFILLLFVLVSAIKDAENWKWYLMYGGLSVIIIPLISFILVALVASTNTPLSYWLSNHIYYSWSKTVGNPSFHEVKNQNNEVKEIFDQGDVISARHFQLEILSTGYDDTGKHKTDIDEFLANSGTKKGRTMFFDKYCYAEFKITNLVSRGYRIDGRNISATKVENKNYNNFEQITFYPSNKRNTYHMDNAGDWKTGIVAFDCEKNNSTMYLVSFSSCSLRMGCGDENENDCLGNPSCPYKSHEEYIRDIKFRVFI